MISIALYKPDIPQNTAAILRLSACLKIKVHIIEPCAFNLADPRFRRVIMDYNRFITLKKYHDYDSFDNDNHKSRIIYRDSVSLDDPFKITAALINGNFDMYYQIKSLKLNF